MSLTAGTDTYTLSSSIERIIDMYVTPVGAVRGSTLVATSIADIIDRRQGSTAANAGGYVTHYALQGIDQFTVWPVPLQADTITLYYVSLPTALAADGDIPILHEPWSKLLFYGACADAGSFKGDPQAQEYAALFEAWLGRFRTHLNRKKGTTTRQFRLVGTHPYPPHDPSTYPGW